MKRKLLSLAMVIMLLISIIPTSFAEGAVAGLENFKKTNKYTPGMFKDVFSSDWYAENVIAAYQFGLVKGTTATNFNPKGNLTVAETIVLACRLHSIYNGGTGEFTQGSPWYQVYVDYALANRIIPGTYSDYNAKISRANFAFILNNSLPSNALREINNITTGDLKDVASDSREEAIYNLYRAGILTGNDKYGTFNPNSNIQRSEVATIVTRMADLTQRKMFMLEERPADPQSITLTGKTSIKVGETTQWKATISPAGASQWVSWSSGNPGVATVDANGNVKGLKDGQSNITATTGNGIKKTVLLTVGTINPTSVTLAGKTSIDVGETTQWKATVAPSAANQWVSWSSGNPGVATVDANGNIRALKVGETNITATAANGVKKTVLIKVTNEKYNRALSYVSSHFRRIKNDYSTAKATNGYAYEFTDLNGNRCVLTYVQYRIVNVYSEFMLYNLSTGAATRNPEDYYKKMINRSYGADKLRGYDIYGELLGHQGEILGAVLDMMTKGINSYGGYYFDQSILN